MSQYSIVVAAHNHARQLLEVLLAIRQRCQAGEVLVIDNASSADLRGVLALAQLPNARLIRLEEHSSLACVLNVGVDSATHDFVLLLHGDVVLTSNPSGAVELLHQQPELGVIGGKLFARGGQPRRLLHAGYLIGRGRVGVQTRGFLEWDRYAAMQEVAAVSSACMLLRRTDVRFDERYWFCLEDVDICLQYAQRGFGVVFVPELQAIDLQAAGLQQRHSDVEWASRELNSHLLHHERWCSDRPLDEWPRQVGVRGLAAKEYLEGVSRRFPLETGLPGDTAAKLRSMALDAPREPATREGLKGPELPKHDQDVRQQHQRV
jgi:GT2 family glycosyltransferase